MESRPPHAYQDFVQKYPLIAKAWETVAQADQSGPLDAKVRRLIKLAIAIGSNREGPFARMSAKPWPRGLRKPRPNRSSPMPQARSDFPGTVAVFTWINDIFEKVDKGST